VAPGHEEFVPQQEADLTHRFRRGHLAVLANLARYGLHGTQQAVQGIDASPRLMVRRLSGIVFNMPWSYGARIKAVPGVVAVTPMNWFGAYWVDRNNQFANFAMDANAVFQVP